LRSAGSASKIGSSVSRRRERVVRAIRTSLCGVVGAFAACAFAAAASADEPAPCPCAPLERPCPDPPEARASVEWGTEADLPHDRGTVSFLRGGLDLEGVSVVSSRVRLRWRLRAEAGEYDLSRPDAVVPGDGHLVGPYRAGQAVAVVDYSFANGWGVAAGPVVAACGDPDASLSESMTYGFKAGVRFPLGGGRSLELGIDFHTVLEDDPSYFPLVRIEGMGHGKVSFEFHGTSLRVGYPLTERLSIGFDARYDRRDVRLPADDRVPHGVFRDIRYEAGLDLEFRPRPWIGVRVGVLVPVDHEIRIDDRHGDGVTDLDATGGVVIGAMVSIEI
jgi:hypothetical protein